MIRIGIKCRGIQRRRKSEAQVDKAEKYKVNCMNASSGKIRIKDWQVTGKEKHMLKKNQTINKQIKEQ